MKAKPRLARWQVVAFRPKRNAEDPLNKTEYEGLIVTSEDIYYRLGPVEEHIGISLQVKGYVSSRHNDYAFIMMLMLTSAIGEYDYATKVGKIGIRPFKDLEDYHPYSQLHLDFDLAAKRLNILD